MKINRNRILSLVLTLILILPLPIYGEELDLNYLDEMINFTQENYVKPVSREQLIENSIKGVFENLDNHSHYYNSEEFPHIIEEIDGNFVGIGAYIREANGYIEIVDTIKGSPAQKKGLFSGDMILNISGNSTQGLTARQATDLIKGEVGSKVRLKIKRKDRKYTTVIERDRVEINPVDYEILNDIAYIRLAQFNVNSYKEVKKALDHIDKLEIENIILDIRDNPGGYLDQAVYIGSEFIKEGPITHIKYKNREGVTYDSYLKEGKYNLALLVNQNSASASEILAAAVKDRSSGVVIGTTTFGKGTVQEVLALERGDGIKLTVAEYFSPNMNKIEGRGVIPTIVVENSFGEDKQLEKAIEFFTIP